MTTSQNRKKVAVIGGGVIGVTTAHALINAGCDVDVFEKGSTVALTSSFAGGGVSAQGGISSLNAPETMSRYIKQVFSKHSALRIGLRANPRQWGFLARVVLNSSASKQAIEVNHLVSLANYSHSYKQQFDLVMPFDHELVAGRLHVFRFQKDLDRAITKLATLQSLGVKYSVLDTQGCFAIEPSLSTQSPCIGGIYFEQESAANVALFTKQLKQYTSNQGVTYKFEHSVTGVIAQGNGWQVQAQYLGSHADHKSQQLHTVSETYDAVVFATGSDSLNVLQSLGIKIPLYPVRGYSLTLPIQNLEDAPKATIFDEHLQVNMTRLGLRLRLSGQAEIGGDALIDDASRSAGKLMLQDGAIRTLSHVLQTWFPYCGKLSEASYWCGTYPTLPDGPPVVGQTHQKGIFLNMGHGSNGWGLSFGAAQIIAREITGQSQEIDISGFSAQRWLKR